MLYPTAYDCYPAAYPYVLGVMACDNSGNIAEFSNWDYIIGENGEYELAAPGVKIYSTLPGDRYASWSGTSMAAPNVSAAAAIIRSRYTNKNKYTSRYIMGQLVSATKGTANKYDQFGRLLNIYPALHIEDSLTYQPKPEIKLNEFYLFDDPAVSASNNGDGIAQPGEIIDIGVRAFNRWGIAENVTVTVDAISDGGVANPYVEFVTDIAEIGEIGTFATGNNGFTYTDGALTSVSKPLRLKLKEGSPNDAMVQLNFTATATNGMDETDTNTYSFTNSHTITIQNGFPRSGVIREDMTLTADKYWIIQNNVLIPEGVTVTVEPGTQIQFWSADPANPYADNADVYIQVEGRFIADGTEEQPIQMFPGKGFEKRKVNFNCFVDRGLVADNNYDAYYVKLKYVNILNPGDKYEDTTYPQYQQHNYVTILDHCTLKSNASDLWPKCYFIDAAICSNTIFSGIDTSGSQRFIYEHDVNTCMFNNISDDYGYSDAGVMLMRKPFNINNSVFCNYTMANDMGIEGIQYFQGSQFSNNAILNNYLSTFMHSNTGHNMYDISRNYWGSDNASLVKKQVFDADRNVSYDDLIQEPFLTLEDDMSSIYPFMTEAYLTDSDDNRINTAAAQNGRTEFK